MLRAVRLTGAVYFDFELSSPWVAEAPPSREIAGIVMPGAQRVIEYHLIARGTCWGHAVGQEPMRLQEGDLIVFPQGDAHVLSSAPGMRAAPDIVGVCSSRLRRCRWSTSSVVAVPSARGSSAAFSAATNVRTTRCSPRCRVIHFAAADSQATTGWLGTLHEHRREGIGQRAAGQRERSGAPVRADVRRDDPPVSRDAAAGPDGLARGIAGSGRRTGAGRAARRGERSRGRWSGWRDWSGVSRSVLAERFVEMVGQPPMQYLALWRMQLASRLLVEGGQVATVAGAVGYESEAAFSRAFKKLMGQSPASWRKSAAPRIPER